MYHVGSDLIDFRSLAWQCKEKTHMASSCIWPVRPQVTAELEKLFYMFGFPKRLHSDNVG